MAHYPSYLVTAGRSAASFDHRLFGLIAVAVLSASCSGGQSTEDLSGGQSTADSRPTGSVTSTTKKAKTLLARRYEIGERVIYDEGNKLPGGSYYLSVDPKTPTKVVPCDRPHIYEITGTFQLRGRSEYPTPEQWNEILRKSDDGCRSYTERFLKAPTRPVRQVHLDRIHTLPRLLGKGEP